MEDTIKKLLCFHFGHKWTQLKPNYCEMPNGGQLCSRCRHYDWYKNLKNII